MPAWSFDPHDVRAAFRSAATAFTDIIEQIPATAWDEAATDQWSVRDLVGHTSRALSTVEQYLEATDAHTDIELHHPIDYFAVLSSAHADPDAIVARGREAGRALGDAPARAIAELARRALDRVQLAHDDTPVTTPAGTMRLVDYLPSRVFELTVHRLDLVAATGLPNTDDHPGIEMSLALAAGLTTLRPEAAPVLLALTGRGPLPAGFSVV